MADLDFTVPLFPLPTVILRIESSSRLFCSRCASNSIPLPTSATPRTTFTCRACCDALRKARDPQTSAQLAEIGAGIDARVCRESFAADVRGENFNGRQA